MTPAEKLSRSRKRKPPSTRQRSHPWKHCAVRQKRTELRLTIAEVAKAVGMSGSGLYEIELGSDPQLTTAVKLAKFFGATVGELWPD